MTFWRAAGMNYIRYSQIAAQCVRNALKGPAKSEAAKREGTTIKVTNWKDGKSVKKDIDI